MWEQAGESGQSTLCLTQKSAGGISTLFMRVGVNTAILAGPLTGIGRYTLSLIQAFARLGTEIEWVLLGFNQDRLAMLPGGKNIEVAPFRRMGGRAAGTHCLTGCTGAICKGRLCVRWASARHWIGGGCPDSSFRAKASNRAFPGPPVFPNAQRSF